MIVTKDFVFIHFPKNGGTFVTKMLRRIHDRKAPNYWANRLYNRFLGGGYQVNYQEFDKHGPCCDIPDIHRSKKIFSVVRDPFDRYVSSYFFGWWKRYPEDFGVSTELIRKKYPTFPNISFSDFVHICCEEFSSPASPFTRESAIHESHGWYSRNILLYYFQDLDLVAERITKANEEDIQSMTWNQHMFDVNFLHTENLNKELFEFLSSVGYKRDKTRFILDAEKVRPEDESEDRGKASPEEMFTPDLLDYVIRKERIFFSVFKEYKTSNVLGVDVQ